MARFAFVLALVLMMIGAGFGMTGSPATSHAQGEATPVADVADVVESLFVVDGVDAPILASAQIDQSSVSEPRLVVERIVLPAGSSLPPRTTLAHELLYVEEGILSVEDDFGFGASISTGDQLAFNPNTHYTAANGGANRVTLLRFSLATGEEALVEEPDQDFDTALAATPDAATPAAVATTAEPQRDLLLDQPLADLADDPVTMFIARATFEPDSASGERSHAGPIGLIIEAGSLTVLSPSGMSGQLDPGRAVVLPEDAPLVASNETNADATALIIGVVEADNGLMGEVTPEPTATPVPTETPVPTPTTEPTATPEPTATAEPSPTPEPTATLAPTPTPTPDPETQALLDTLEGYRVAWEACNPEGMLLYVTDFVLWQIDTDPGERVTDWNVIDGYERLANEFRDNCANTAGSERYIEIVNPDISYVGSIGAIGFQWIVEAAWTDETGRYRCTVSEGTTSWRLEQQVDGRWLITDRSHSQQEVRRSCRNLAPSESALGGNDSQESADSLQSILAGGSSAEATTSSAAQAVASIARIEDLLPTQNEAPPGLDILEEGSRTADQITRTFPDPDDAARSFAAWMWQESVFRTFAAPDNPPDPHGISLLDVSIHRFGTAQGAQAALPYLVDARVEILGLQPVPMESLGDTSQAIAGARPDGNEASLYVQQGNILIRLMALSPDGNPMPDALTHMRTLLTKTV